MKILDSILDRFAGIAVQKMLKRVVQLIIARLIALNLGAFGVTVDADALTLATMAAVERLRIFLKVKYNLTWL